MKRQLYFLTKVFSAFVFTIVFWTTSFAQTLQADKDALIAFYNATGGPNWTTKTNWLVGDPSTWYGVTVESGRVTRIRLTENNLVGSIPFSFSNLIKLKEIKLNRNYLTGEFNIVTLNYLEDVDISVNSISSIRTFNSLQYYYNSLQYLSLSGNSITGIIDISSMPALIKYTDQNITSHKFVTNSNPYFYNSLDWLVLDNSNIEGELNIQGMPNLRYCMAYNNNITSFITNTSGGYYSKFNTLSLGRNDIHGGVNISNMQTLVAFEATFNRSDWSLITNTSPSYYSSLLSLQFSNSNLTGTLDISNMPHLTGLSAEVNKISQFITNHSPGYYTGSQIDLRISDNLLTGDIDITNMQGLIYFDINNNQFERIIMHLPFSGYYNNLLSMGTIGLMNNRLDFDDIEPYIVITNTYPQYSPQAKIGTEQTIYVTDGSVLSLNIAVGGTANKYQWFRNGASLGAPSTNPTLTITPVVAASHAGDYTLQVTNTIATGLTLSSYPIHVVVTPPCFDKSPVTPVYPSFGNSISVTPTELFKWTVNKVPLLSPPGTDNKHTVVLQVAPPAYDPVTGREYPDWANKTEQLFTYPSTSPLAIRDYTANINSMITPGLEEKNYFWRVGVRYIVPSGGNDPVLWSSPIKFSVKPDYNSFAGYLANETQHTNKINWVYEATFADAGMTSQSINYVDGLGKSRQIQGLSNAASSGGGVQGNVLCQEVVYSEEGGGALQSMSAPLGRNTFAYEHRFFDVNDNGTLRDFSTKDFDREVITSSTDKSLISPTTVEVNASNTKGVGYYYSNYNTLEPYVDDASGYAYAYSASYKDPLGLGMVSSGLGSTFRMNAGKEVRTFYGQPSQEELNRVYGPAAPLARNISKTTTYDQNGIGSVTYLDNEGKTIATALTVCSAPNLEAVIEDGRDDFNSTVNVLMNDNVDLNVLNKTATSKFTTTCTGQTVNLNYTLTLSTFPVNSTSCSNCKYDLTIRITEDATGKEIYKKVNNFNPTLQCGNGGLAPLLSNTPISIPNPGTYTVWRTIDPMKEANGKTVVENMIDQEVNYLNTHIAEYRAKFDQEMSEKTDYYLIRPQTSYMNLKNPNAVNLITNGDFSQGNTGFTSEYLLYANQNPPYRTYLVGDKSTQILPTDPLVKDHTSGSGNFFMADSPDLQNGSNYYIAYSTTVNVNPNKDYTFKAWINTLRVYTPTSYPQLRLYINGTPVGGLFSSSTISIWEQMVRTWNSGSSTQATISIVNEFLLGYGNDFALDDLILTETCGEKPASLTLTFPKSVNLVKNGDFSLGNKYFTSDYTYTSTALSSSQGYYNVERNGNMLNTAYSGVDNTSGNGRFLMVDGHGTANKTIWQQQIDVTPSTSYNFSFNLTSISAASMPINNRASMRVYINGVIVGSTIPAPGIMDTWSRLMYTWSSGTSTTAIIRIVDVAGTSTGNDFGLDDIMFAKVESYNILNGVGNLLSTPITSQTTDLASAQALATEVNNRNLNYTATAATSAEGNVNITFSGKPGQGTSLNNYNIGIGTRFYIPNYGYTYDYSISNGVMSGGLSGTCIENTYLLDKVDISMNADGITGILSGGDGRTALMDPVGLETYNFTSIADITSTLSSSSLFSIETLFQDGYYTAYYRKLDLSNDVSSFQVFSINGVGLSGNNIIMLDDNRMIVPPYNTGAFYLVKVKIKGQTCANQCLPVLDNSSCRSSCDQQRSYLLGAYLNLKYQVDNNTTPIWPSGYVSKTLSALIAAGYPNITGYEAYAKEMANLEDVNSLYEEFVNAREAYRAFDFQRCVNQCERPSQDPCTSCENEYITCVRENANNLSLGHEYLMTKWNVNEGINDPFPYVLTDLKDAQGKENQAERENLGSDLFDALITKLQNSEVFVESDWNLVSEITSTNCTTCSSPGSSSFGCQGKSVPMNAGLQYPTKLLPILQAANQKCLDSYNNDCFNVTDPAKTENYICGQNVQRCLDMYDPEKSDIPWTQYSTNCTQQFSCPGFDAMADKKKSMIREALAPYYVDVTVLEQQVSSIYLQYKDVSIQELSKALIEKASNLACAKRCEDFNNALFLSWMEVQKDKIRQTIKTNFINYCFGLMNETFTVTFPQKIYHYTLYNYDRANNLIGTVSPEGVDFVNTNGTETPVHVLKTTYKVSSVGEILSSTTPDGGTTTYLYDKASRIRFSQNAEQVQRGTACGVMIFSYTKYDVETGRILEIGEQKYSGLVTSGAFKRTVPSAPVGFISDNVNSTLFPTSAGSEKTNFYYDTPETVDGILQTYTNRRVTKSVRDNAVTYYSYDGHGRVKWYKQYLPETGYKTTEYEFLPVSSRVEKIWYQKGIAKEQFTHRYFYDTDQRMTSAEISTDNGVTWNPAGKYAYYTHGTLKEVGMGNNIQRMNYTYNLQGWIKAINHTFAANDPGKDGVSGSGSPYSKDVFGMILNYYTGDYQRTGTELTSTASIMPGSTAAIKTAGKDLFNGNISGTISYTGHDQTGTSPAESLMGSGYKYDYLNRLIGATRELKHAAGFTSWSQTASEKYSEFYWYDANGNIVNTWKYAATAAIMDNLQYKYNNFPNESTTKKTSNRLLYVQEDGPDLANYDDIAYQGTFNQLSDANYTYDAKGRLIGDKKNEIALISWTIYDKVASVRRTASSLKPNLYFTYDPAGRRLTKKVVYPTASDTRNKTTYYVYEASGMLMSVYDRQDNVTQTVPTGMTSVKINFQPSSVTNTPSGYLADNGAVYASRGNGYSYGWDIANTTGAFVNSNAYPDLTNQTYLILRTSTVPVTTYTWELGLTNGTYNVKVVTGRPDLAVTSRVTIEGTAYTDPDGSSPTDNFDEFNVSVTITDGKLTITSVGSNVPISSVEVTSPGLPATVYEYTLKEQYMYGAARLGSYNRGQSLNSGATVVAFSATKLSFELTDHLGNTRAIVSGQKKADGSAEILYLADYYAFGMVMPSGREFKASGGDYRFGFNGKEDDDETSWQDYGFRMYDPRIGRFFSVDPLQWAYPELTPYQFAANMPIWMVDLDGLEAGLAPITGVEGPSSPAPYVLPEITVFGSRPSEDPIVSDIPNPPTWEEYLTKVLNDAMRESSAFAEGFNHQYITNTFSPSGEPMFTYDGVDRSSYEMGQFAANAITVIQGGAELLGGSGLFLGGGAVSITGVGAIPGVAVSAGGLAVAGHGAVMVKNAILNMAGVNKSNDELHNGNSGGEGSNNTGGEFTEPTLPEKTIAKENGVEIVHYTRSGDHGPPHLHVKGGGPETKIGSNGKPLEGSPGLTTKQREVVEKNKAQIRKAIKKIGRYYWYQNRNN